MSSKYTWDIQSIGARPTDQAPLTSITLQTQTTGYYVGEYVGKCGAVDESSSGLPPGELSATVCSWMDDAVEIGVFYGIQGKEVRAIEHFRGSSEPSTNTRVLFQLNANE